MRKAQKSQILEIIQSLQEVHGEIHKLLEQKDYHTAQSVLADCQQGVIEIGEVIEKSEGEESPAVKQIENYCETVFQLYQQIEQAMAPDACETQKMMDELSVKEEASKKALEQILEKAVSIRVRKEVAFFPYKASMWDSLESVYLAAKADPDCDAYCVPIPYFDRNPDRSFAQMHYEGLEYPKNIEVIDWETYNFEERRPDVIYIHNPYDDKNYVTCVHPRYFSSNLKKFTERLVYIPYFVTPGMLGLEFCITPGFLNADKVIVQSESVRKHYMQAAYQMQKLNNEKKNFGKIRQKIVALGSPKIEKAAGCAKEEYDLPAKWCNLIEKSDGTRKKVIFYNTSLSTLLQEDERYLQKLHSVLKIFRAQTDVVLWWRPHPLSEVMLCSMRPKLLAEYKKIVDEYLNDGWGIYDDTSDLYRAIAWSDAYYGDRSSVTMLFSAAKKPVMIQNVQNDKIAFENFIYSNGFYWFTSFGFNGLFRLDRKMDNAEFMGCFSEENAFRLYSDVVEYDNRLIFTPFTADAIAVYCMDTKKFISVPLKQPQKSRKRAVAYSKEGKFKYCATYGKYAFMFPSTYPAVIKFDMETFEVEYLYEPISTLEKIVQHKKTFYFQSGFEKENVISLWCVAANALVEFNMVDNTFKICYRLNCDEKYIEAVNDGENYWLIPCNNESQILKLSEKYLAVDTVEIPDGVVERNLPFLHAVCMKENIWIFPRTANNVLRIPITGTSAEIQHEFDVVNLELQQERPDDWKFFFAKIIDKTFFAFNNYSQELFIYDVSTESLKKKGISADIGAHIDNKLFFSALDLQYKNAKEEADLYIYESSRTPFYSFLDIVQEAEGRETLNMILFEGLEKVRKHNETPENEGIGSSIYEYVKDYM